MKCVASFIAEASLRLFLSFLFMLEPNRIMQQYDWLVFVQIACETSAPRSPVNFPHPPGATGPICMLLGCAGLLCQIGTMHEVDFDTDFYILIAYG